MTVEVRLPQWGMGMTDGIVVEWFVQEGDEVEEAAVLVEVEGAKVTGEVTAPVSGVVVQILAAVDDVVDVGGLLALMEPRP